METSSYLYESWDSLLKGWGWLECLVVRLDGEEEGGV